MAGGTGTPYQDIGAGACTATATIQNESATPTVTFNASEDVNYTVVIVNANPPVLRVDEFEK